MRWRRYVDKSPLVVTALAVNPTGLYLAVVLTDSTSMPELTPESNKVFFFTVRTVDGGHHTNLFSYQLGSTSEGLHYIRDKGIVYADSGKIYMAAFSRSLRNGIAGRQMVLAYNPSALNLDWALEQSSWYGYSVTVLHKNYCASCANIFVGGSEEHTKGQWVLSITRLTEAGVSPPNSVFQIN